MVVERELLLVKVSILGPEYLHEQLKAIKYEEYNNEFMPEADLRAEVFIIFKIFNKKKI